jgi:hypothetical protein
MEINESNSQQRKLKDLRISTIPGMAMNAREEKRNALAELPGQNAARPSGLSSHEDGSRRLTGISPQSLYPRKVKVHRLES